MIIQSRVDRFFAVQRKAASARGESVSRAYDMALSKAWTGKWSEALHIVSMFLGEDPEHESRFQLYRLWIECAANTGDMPSLRILRDHLFERCRADGMDAPSYMALRGIVSLELDEVGAAKLFLKGASDRRHDQHALELSHRLQMRHGVPTTLDVVEQANIFDCVVPLSDYFVWQTLLDTTYAEGHNAVVGKIVAYIESSFPGSPGPARHGVIQAFAERSYAIAVREAARLTELDPVNSDNYFLSALATFKAGDAKGALRIIESEIVSVAAATDPDFASLRSECIEALERREVARFSNGPSAQAWLVKISPRRMHELMTSPRKEIRHLSRPLGNVPKPGDTCFFATEIPERGGSRWVINAVYQVASDATWHPIDRFHSKLHLVSILPSGVPVDLRVDGVIDRRGLVERHDQFSGTNRRSAERDMPARFGVFELEPAALETIRLALEEKHGDWLARANEEENRALALG